MNDKVIIWDWAGTLWDYQTEDLFFDAVQVLDHLKMSKYRMMLVSLATSENSKDRRQRIHDLGLSKYFENIFIGDKDKDEMYEQAIKGLKIGMKDIIIIDDRIIRGIRWGNQKGATTVWFQKGKFAQEFPNKETGQPDFVIHELGEIKKIF